MRWLLALTALLCTTGCGLLQRAHEVEQHRTLARLVRLMEETLWLLESTGADRETLLRHAARRSAPDDPVSLETLCDRLTGPALDLCRRFDDGLGTTPLPQQRAHCESCIAEGRRLLTRSRTRLAERRRLTLSLPLLGGLFAVILFF